MLALQTTHGARMGIGITDRSHQDPKRTLGSAPFLSARARYAMCMSGLRSQEWEANFQIREVMLEKLLVFFNQFRHISDIILILET